MFCFLLALSSAKAWQKSQQTGNEAAALSFFCFSSFFSLSSWLTYSVLRFPNCHLPSSNCFQIPWSSCKGATLSGVPICFWNIDEHKDLEEELIPPALAPLFFCSDFPSPNFPGSWVFLSKQGAKQETWAPWTFRPWWLCYCTWSSVLQLSCHIFGNDLLTGYSCCSRPFPHLDPASQGLHLPPSWKALPKVGRRPQQSEGAKRVSKTSPELEQARLGDTARRGGTNKVSFAVITRMFLNCQVLGSRKLWFSIGLWNAA